MRSENFKRNLPAELPDQELLPSFDGSNHVLQLLLFPAGKVLAAGERYYFDQNSKIDGKTVTAVEVHYVLNGFIFGATIDMFTTYNENGVNYNVLQYNDYKNLLLSLSTMKEEIKIERSPASSFIVLPSLPLAVPNANPKMHKPLEIEIGTRNCFIEFTQAPATALPMVVPISIYYK